MRSRSLPWAAPLALAFLSLTRTSVAPAEEPRAAFTGGPGGPVAAVAGPNDRRPDTYGTSAMTAWTMSAVAFSPNDSSTTYTYSTINGGQYITGGHQFLNHSLQLPEGAEIVRIELDGCDNSSTGFLTLRLSKCAVGGPCTDLAGVGTQPADAPGCGRFPLDVTPAITVDNYNNSYNVNVEVEGATGNASFFAVRVYYKLQVSPAPLTATFADVPTGYLFFRHIEALAAAGITTGCGAGNFCPQQSVTRGEMAAFLAKALGLHFAP